MPNSQKQAVIALIEKQGKDHMLMENVRPVCLVSVGGKIISKVIVSRIKKCVNAISFTAIKLVTSKIAILVRQ